MQFDKEFGLPGRDLLHKHDVKIILNKHLSALNGCKVHVKLIPGSQRMFCKARIISLLFQEKVPEKLEQVVGRGILEPVQPGGVINASPVVWQRMKIGELNLKMQINGKVMDDDYPIPEMETILHNIHGPHNLARWSSQMPTIKSNLTKRQKIYAQSTDLRDCSRCGDYLKD